MSKTLTFEINDDILSALQEDPEDMIREMRLFSAVRWYESGRLSQSKAAEIAGLTRTEFVATLSRFSVTPFQETSDEIAQGLSD